MTDADTNLQPDALQHDLEFALELADLADVHNLPRWARQDFTLGWTDDRSEVTEVDRACEAMLAERVLRARPEHSFFGEEHGLQGPADSPWRWVVDPIDGTSGFVRGLPVWGTLIALLHTCPDGTARPVVAVISAPALNKRWWASKGGGTFTSDPSPGGVRPCRVSEVADLAHAQLSVTFTPGWESLGLTGELVALMQAARRPRGFGDFWQHCLVAEGGLDAAIDAVELGIYDIVAPRLIVEEAGGVFTDRFGNPDPVAEPSGRFSAVSSNGRVHAALVDRLGR